MCDNEPERFLPDIEERRRRNRELLAEASRRLGLEERPPSE